MSKIGKRLLQKYGNLKFRDDDNDVILTINPKYCFYKDVKAPNKAEYVYILYSMKDGDDVDDLVMQEPLELNFVIEQIMEYSDPNVEIIPLPNSGGKNKENDSEKKSEETNKKQKIQSLWKKESTSQC